MIYSEYTLFSDFRIRFYLLDNDFIHISFTYKFRFVVFTCTVLVLPGELGPEREAQIIEMMPKHERLLCPHTKARTQEANTVSCVFCFWG